MLSFLLLKKQYEKFTEKRKKEGFDEMTDIVYVYVFVVIGLFLLAVYLSFKCHKGLNIVDLFLAIFFTPCYLLYRLINGCN